MEVITISIYMDLTRKTDSSEEWSCSKSNNLGLVLGMALKICTSVEKGLKLKVRKFQGIIPMFGEVTGEKLARGLFSPPFLNRVNGSVFSDLIFLNGPISF